MIDLRSDTVTRPSDAMREAAATAEVGDDVHHGDPTVKDLEARVAEILDREAALFVPSGTMGNQIAVNVHTEPGQEVLLERECHIYKYELGGAATHSGLQTRPTHGDDRGVLTPEAIEDGYVTADPHRPGTGLVSLENTHNSKGGTAISAADMAAACEAAHARDVPVHVDGARLFNAAAALETPAAELVADADSVMCCLSKGLGAPIGSMLVGESAFIEAARRVRKRFGGGMRQVGIVAAPGLLALENRERLADDHANARRLAEGLADVAGFGVREPETNILLVETDDPAEAVLDRLESVGVLASQFDEHLIRFCTHLDVDRDDVDEGIERIRDL